MPFSRAFRYHVLYHMEEVCLLQESVTWDRKKLEWSRQSQTIPVAASSSSPKRRPIMSASSVSFPLIL